ncbi:MAG: FAD-dependent oxidoreductase [Bacilli bacterium]|nr:FAD-dependent oxidoreductase [Bacilli bacterium]
MNNKSIWDRDLYPLSFPVLKENIKTDVLIIGAGISGLSCAYELLDQALSITIVDQNAIYQGTTLRTTAKVTYQHGYIYHDLIKKHGIDKTKDYYEFNLSGLKRIEEIQNKEKIDCDFRKVDGYLFARVLTEKPNIDREISAYEKVGIKSLLTYLDPIISPYYALKVSDQANFNITKYLKKITDILLARGVVIYENTRIIDVRADIDTIATTADNKKIVARKIIICNHYPVYKKFNFFFTKMIPYLSYAVAAAADNIKIPDANFINTENPTIALRYITYQGKQLLNISGASHESYQFKQTISEASRLKKFGKDHFGINEYLFGWCAQDYTTTDLLPLIGMIKNNIYIATSYNKWGMAAAAAGAMLIRDLIEKNDSRFASTFNPTRSAINCKFFRYNLKVLATLIKTRWIPTKKIIKIKPDSCKIFKKCGKRIGIYKDRDYKLYIVDVTCPHLRCGLRFNNLAKTYDCKCHGSRFSYEGKLIDGPAVYNLNKIAITELQEYLDK